MSWIKKGTETSIKEVFLRNIGVSDTEEINEWYRRSMRGDYKITDLDKAVNLAKHYKDSVITIVGDYDADGITSTSILYNGLRLAGFKNIKYRIPKRFSEGFGINPAIIDEINEGLIITCDNGVAQPESINKAVDKGLKVIILDHHEPIIDDCGNPVLPNADVIIDPHAIERSADFDGYCGAGLSYKFIELMLGEEIPSLMALCAIGTVADVMELREENYVYVRKGLKYMNENKVGKGLLALLSALNARNITAHDIGFKIGPVINASSRLNDDGAKDVVELFISLLAYPTLIPVAEKLVEVNEERKKEKKTGLIKAESIIADECLFGDCPLTVYVPDVKEGVIGILAGSLCEEYKVPTLVFTDSEDPDILKGSARSPEGCNIKDLLDTVNAINPTMIYKYGGHAGAAGISIYKDKLSIFRESLINNIGEFEFKSITDFYYDLEIDAADIKDTIEELAKYEPFGNGNEPIVFKINNFSCMPKYGTLTKKVGDNHIKVFGKGVEAIGFNMADKMSKDPGNMNLIGTLSTNYFMGSITNQVEFVDFQSLAPAKVVTPLASRLAKMAMATTT